MTCTPAQLAANRRNALRSSGPRSTEGKERSRRNALKHGLTGQGVALPSEDKAEIERRFSSLQKDLRPSNDLAEQLVRRVAFMTVRLERCEKHETSETAKRVRHAIALYDDERLAAVEALGHKLYTEPATTARRLQMTPEGIDWLLNDWSILRADLNHVDGNRWTGNHRMRFDSLLGLNPGGYRIGRIMALSEAVDGGFYHLDKADGEGLEGPARAEWAKVELTRLLDAETARLEEARGRIDHEALAADRAEAVDRALFDASKEMILARKYEAATERGLYRALKEFRAVQADAAAEVEVEEVEVEVEAEIEAEEPGPEEVESDEPPPPARQQFAPAASVPVVSPVSISGPMDDAPRMLHAFVPRTA